MTRNEVKELLPIMQAFAEGKTIEERIIGTDNWIETDEIYGGRNNDYDYRVNYHIKPEPKYRPFANAEECLEEMKKHVPFGWVKDKYSFYPIERVGTNFGKKCIRNYGIWNTLEQMFKDVTFLDGTPFGVKIEEDKQ